MAKSVEQRYQDLSREEIIDRCERYRRQIGGMSRKPNNSKQELKKLRSENHKLKNLIQELFDEYVESHTWIECSGQHCLSHMEFDQILKFEKSLDELNIEHKMVPHKDEIN